MLLLIFILFTFTASFFSALKLKDKNSDCLILSVVIFLMILKISLYTTGYFNLSDKYIFTAGLILSSLLLCFGVYFSKESFKDGLLSLKPAKSFSETPHIFYLIPLSAFIFFILRFNSFESYCNSSTSFALIHSKIYMENLKDVYDIIPLAFINNIHILDFKNLIFLLFSSYILFKIIYELYENFTCALSGFLILFLLPLNNLTKVLFMLLFIYYLIIILKGRKNTYNIILCLISGVNTLILNFPFEFQLILPGQFKNIIFIITVLYFIIAAFYNFFKGKRIFLYILIIFLPFLFIKDNYGVYTILSIIMYSAFISKIKFSKFSIYNILLLIIPFIFTYSNFIEIKNKDYDNIVFERINSEYENKSFLLKNIKYSPYMTGEKIINSFGDDTDNADFILSDNNFKIAKTPYAHNYEYSKSYDNLDLYKKVKDENRISLKYKSIFNNISFIEDSNILNIIIDDRFFDLKKDVLNLITINHNIIDINYYDINNQEILSHTINTVPTSTIVILTGVFENNFVLTDDMMNALSVLGVNYINEFYENEKMLIINSIDNSIKSPFVYRETNKPLIKHFKLNENKNI